MPEIDRQAVDLLNEPDAESDPDLREALDSAPQARFQYLASPQEDQFARACVVMPSIRQAYLLAGFPAGTNTLQMASRLRGTPRIEERVAHYAAVQAARLDIRDERLLAELAAVAFSDPADFYGPDGDKLVNIHDIPRHARAAIKTINDDTRTTVDVEGNVTTNRSTHIALIDKGKALETLIRVKGLIKDPKTAASATPVVIIDMSGTQTKVIAHEPTDEADIETLLQ